MGPAVYDKKQSQQAIRPSGLPGPVLVSVLCVTSGWPEIPGLMRLNTFGAPGGVTNTAAPRTGGGAQCQFGALAKGLGAPPWAAGCAVAHELPNALTASSPLGHAFLRTVCTTFSALCAPLFSAVSHTFGAHFWSRFSTSLRKVSIFQGITSFLPIF